MRRKRETSDDILAFEREPVPEMLVSLHERLNEAYLRYTLILLMRTLANTHTHTGADMHTHVTNTNKGGFRRPGKKL